jgi:hypothetical protein
MPPDHWVLTQKSSAAVVNCGLSRTFSEVLVCEARSKREVIQLKSTNIHLEGV